VNPDDRARVLDTVQGRGGELILLERQAPSGVEREIRIDGRFAMSTSDEYTSRLLARASLGRLDREKGIRVLVGGLGLGLTLREVLDDSRVEAVTVAEIEEAIIRWNRTLLRECSGGALFDPRVRIFHGDVRRLFGESEGVFDAILMDVDNGPSFLLHEANVSLYSDEGICAMRESLSPGGVLAVWAGQPEPDLERTLRKYFEDVRVEFVADRGTADNIPPTAIYTARMKG
jgi:spermidine synthase